MCDGGWSVGRGRIGLRGRCIGRLVVCVVTCLGAWLLYLVWLVGEFCFQTFSDSFQFPSYVLVFIATTDKIFRVHVQDTVSRAALRQSFCDYIVRVSPRSRYSLLRCPAAADALDLFFNHGFTCRAEVVSLEGNRIELHAVLRALPRISGRVPYAKELYWVVSPQLALVDAYSGTRYSTMIANTPISTRVAVGDSIDLILRNLGHSRTSPGLWVHIPIDL